MVEYPKAVYHARQGCRVVHSAEAQAALGAGWYESPALCPEPAADLLLEPESPKGELSDPNPSAPEPAADLDIAPRKKSRK